MNVGFFLQGYSYGGTEKIISETINNWKNANDKVFLFCNSDHNGLKNIKQAIPKKAKIITYPSNIIFKNIKDSNNFSFLKFIEILYYIFFNYLSILYEVFFFKNLLSRYNLKTLYVHNGGWPAARMIRSAVIAANTLKIKNIILVIHGIVKPHHFLIKFQEKVLEKIIASLNIKVVTVSKAAARSIKKNTYLPNPKIIHNGTKIRRKPKSIRSVLKIEKKTFIILSIGTLDLNRGHHVLIESLSKVLQIEKDIMLLIVGKGSKKQIEFLQNIINKRKIKKNVKLLGFREDTDYLIYSCNLVVQPVIFTESFGLVLIEAMSLRKPVIASKIEAINEIVDNNKTGLVFQAQNVDILSKKILQLYNSSELQKKYGENGYKKYKKLFTLDNMIAKYKNLIE